MSEENEKVKGIKTGLPHLCTLQEARTNRWSFCLNNILTFGVIQCIKSLMRTSQNLMRIKMLKDVDPVIISRFQRHKKKNLNINANDYLRLLEISIYKPQARLVDNTGTSSASPAKEWSKEVHTLINAFIIPTPTCKGCYQSSATTTKPILSIIEQ